MTEHLEGFSLSPQQERLWRVQGRAGDGCLRSEIVARLCGPLDAARLGEAIAAVAVRHEMLRTTFRGTPEMTVPLQVIAPPEAIAGLAWLETVAAAAGGGQAGLESELGRRRAAPAQYQRLPLLEALLVRLGDGEHLLALVLPALCADGESLEILLGEIAGVYADLAAGRGSTAERLQYADLAGWQREQLESEDARSFTLGGSGGAGEIAALLAAALPWETSPPRAAAAGFAVAALDLPAGLAADLGRRAAEMGVETEAILLAAWQLLLALHAGAPVIVGVTIGGREHAGLETALGPLAKSIPLPPPAPGAATFHELAAATGEALAEARGWHEYFAWQLPRESGSAPEPFASFAFDFHRHAPERHAAGLRVSPVVLRAACDRFGLRLHCAVAGAELRAEIQYEVDRYPRPAVLRLARGFAGLLRRCLLAPRSRLAEIDALDEGERHRLLIEMNDTAAPGNALPVHRRFERQAELSPAAVAVAGALAGGPAPLTYAELDAAAERLAARLQAVGAGPDRVVGLLLERSPEMVVAVLGVLKAGGAYLPLDPSYPAARLGFMLEDARAAVVVTSEALRDRLPHGAAAVLVLDGEPPPAAAAAARTAAARTDAATAGPDHLAYVIYTSGSTGRPKGVLVTHRGLGNYLDWCLAAYPVAAGRGTLLHSPLGFDLTVTSLFPPLLAGGAVFLAPEEEGGLGLAAAMRALADLSLVKLTPAHLAILGEALPPEEAAGRARALVIGGEALHGKALRTFRERAPATRLINEYGPTETVVGCAVHEVRAGDPEAAAVAIGRPIVNTRLFVLDALLRPVPAAVPGELFVGGAGVARGYLGRPALTAERFLPDGLSGEAGARLYRTGDLVRFQDDGRLDYLGRIDRQVKLHGVRIELGEVEAALAAHPAVRETAVVMRTDGAATPRLVAYAIPRGDERPAVAELRAFLARSLPEPMLPSAFVFLRAWPLTANGKLDHASLPEPAARSPRDGEYAVPATLVEEVLASLWAAVLRVERVGVDDNFFQLGGDSILSIEVLARCRQRGITFAPAALFQNPTIRGLAPKVALAGATAAAFDSTPPFSLLAGGDRVRLPRDAEDAYPLTQLQSGMLFHSLYAPASSLYHEIMSFRLRARFDAAALAAALGALAERHPALRTTFDLAHFSEPLQIVHRAAAAPLAVADLRGLAPAAREKAIAAWVEVEKRRAFDGPGHGLIRFAVHRRDAETFQFSLSYHHAIVDGWSIASLLTELFIHYRDLLARAPAPEFPASAAAFRDFVAAERRAVGDQEQRGFWRRKLAAVEVLELPRPDRAPGPETPPEIRRRAVAVDEETGAGLLRLARTAGVPLKSVFLAAHLKVLSLLASAPEVTTGIVAHARPQALAAERIAGLFLNTLPLRLELPAGSWSGLVGAALAAEIELLPYQAFPLAEIQRLTGRAPLFETVFNFVNFHVYRAAGGTAGIEVLDGWTVEETNFPLSLVCMIDSELARPLLRLEHDVHRLSAAAAETIAGYLERTLAAMAADPAADHDAFSPLSGAARHQLLVEWNDTATAQLDERPFHEVVRGWAVASPGAAAVVCGERWLAYGELDERAARLASRLRGLGVGAETIVAVCLERGLDLVTALVGILAAGGAYLPLDAAYPPDRLAYMLADSGARLLLAERRTRGRLPDYRGTLLLVDELDEPTPPAGAPPPAAVPEQLAYVIYTSGSTGRPKGVGVTHRGLTNLVTAQRAAFDVGPGDRLLQFSSASFDASIFEIAMALGAGATTVLGAPEELAPGPALAALLARQRVSHVTMPPSILTLLAPAETACPRVVNVAGEACPAALVARWSAGRSFRNLYGPTEATVWSTMETCAAGAGAAAPPIGRPVANVEVHLLDALGRAVAAGAPGELAIGGDGLARGYLGRPELTAARFVPHPWARRPGERLYRTGDLARRLADGRLVFLGRIDRQVKMRGFRIEPGEIEAALREIPAVADAAAVARPDERGEPRLVAYLVPSGAAEPPVGELRALLRARLPEHMLPSAFLYLAALPLTASGKLDVAALPAPEGARPRLREAYAAPRNADERAVASLLAEVLHVERLGRDDNFFDLGAHSLTLLRAQALLEAALGVDLPIVDLFAHPTVRALAASLRRRGGAEAATETAAMEATEEETAAATEAAAAAMPAAGPAGAAPAPEIAVVGMAGRFPGAAGVEELWQLLCDGREAISFFSADELRAAGVEEALLGDPRYVRAKAVLDGVDGFDAAFFGVTPREAEILDPQQRVFLECAWEALEDAGHGNAAGERVGVYAGSSMNGYWLNLLSNPELVETVGGFQLIASNDKDFLASRVSYKLGLQGPSLAVQTACSTSLVAVHVACQALRAGECDMAVAGGVSIRLPQISGYLHLEGGIDSPDGHCRAFDAAAQGTVAGSGVGVVVLKRLADALAGGDPIRAVIRGSAVNNDGSVKVGYTAPSVQGQAQVVRAALRMAGIDAGTIGYVEAHGTGTPLGDPIEVAALGQAFGGAVARGSVALGSLKTNLGHLDAAAGVAGLIKTVLQLERRTLVPSLHLERPNPELQLAASPFHIQTRLEPWRPGATPLRAGVSSFGIGGTNAHLVLEQAPAAAAGAGGRARQLVLLSARTAAALERATDRLADRLGQEPALDPADVAYTLQVGRSELGWRRMLVAAGSGDARDALSARTPGRVISGRCGDTSPAVAFLFPGQGAQHPGMAAGLLGEEPAFRRWIGRCAEVLAGRAGLDLHALLAAPAGDAAAAERWRETEVAQPALFAVEYALARLWMEWGIEPQAMLGHSVGEYVAACLAGVLTLADALDLVAARGRLLQQLPRGAMLAVPLAAAAVAPYLEAGLDLAAINGDELVVVAGGFDAVAGLELALAAHGVQHRRLHTSHAFHSSMMEPAMAPFRREVERVALRPPRIPFLSNLTGTWITPEQATSPEYWTAQLRATVRFADGIAELAREPDRLYLEVGPGQSLVSLARRHPGRGAGQAVVASLPAARDPVPGPEILLGALGRLWLAGQPVRWPAFHAGARRRRVALPAYPFERRRYWVDARPDGARRPAAAAGRSPFDEWFYEIRWRQVVSATAAPATAAPAGEWWVLAGEEPAGRAIARALDRAGCRTVVVHKAERYERRGEREAAIDPGEPEHYRRLIAELGTPPTDVVHCWTLDGGRTGSREPAVLADSALRDGLLSLVHLAQALPARFTADAVRLRVITSGLDEVTGEEPLRPEVATLMGPAIVLAQEHPNLRCRVVDAPAPPRAGPPLARWVESVVEEILAVTPGDERVALRGGFRWRPVVERLPCPVPGARRPPSLRRGGVYLVTGGLGKVGMALAAHLSREWQAKLVLVAQDPDPARQAAVLARLGPGAEVELAFADVADRAQMERVLQLAERRFGALDGVIHAAGLVGPRARRSLQELDRATVAALLRAKVAGGLVLAELLRGRRLDFCLLVSSLAAVLGGLGFAAYAAANSFLDALAGQQRRAGRPWVSVDWDGWTFAAPDGRPDGGTAITPAEGAAALERVLAVPSARRLLVSTTDLAARIERSRAAVGPVAAAGEAEHDLAAPAHARPALSTAYAAPRTETERRLAAIWQSLLGIDGIGVDDSFFELGGHSLLATQLMARVREAFRVNLRLEDVFTRPTVAAMTARIAEGGVAAERPAFLEIVARAAGERPPLSFAQQRLWFFQRLEPASAAYNVFAASRLVGRLDVLAVAASLSEIVRRHEVLRTGFEEADGVPYQAIGPARPVALPSIDLSGIAAGRRDGEARRCFEELTRRPFDLARAPLFRVALCRAGEAEHLLCLVMHHIVCDAWSVAVFNRELGVLYDAFSRRQPSPLAELAVQYASFAVAQRAWLEGGELAAQLDYWRGELAGLPVLEIPTDRPRPARQSFRGATYTFALPAALGAQLRALAQAEDVTLFMLLLAGFQTFLGRYTGQTEVVVGTNVSNRGATALEGLIGFFVNNLVLRTSLAGGPTFRQLLARVRRAAIAAYAHQDLPFERLVEELQRDRQRDPSRHPLFQVLFVLQNAPGRDLALRGLTVRPFELASARAAVDLLFNLWEAEGGIRAAVEYSTDLFDEPTVARLCGYFATALANLAADPDADAGAISLVEAEAQGCLAGDFNAELVGPPAAARGEKG
jgi:amino acid adenylation domain-containing protein